MITIYCKNRDKLYDHIVDKVSKGEMGEWKLDEDKDLYLGDPQWTGRAWMSFYSPEDKEQLIIRILGTCTKPIDRLTYNMYHTRLVEVLIKKFYDKFDRMEMTSWLDPTYDSSISNEESTSSVESLVE